MPLLFKILAVFISLAWPLTGFFYDQSFQGLLIKGQIFLRSFVYRYAKLLLFPQSGPEKHETCSLDSSSPAVHNSLLIFSLKGGLHVSPQIRFRNAIC
jgi:hypothetical protein